MTFHLTSPSFANGQPIPARHTGDGEDVSPALQWSDPPPGTKSFALVVHDPDAPDPTAPTRDVVHWVLYNLPAGVLSLSLPEGTTRATLPLGSREGLNESGATGWHGPRPPIGRHRYFFNLYALDTELPTSARRHGAMSRLQ